MLYGLGALESTLSALEASLVIWYPMLPHMSKVLVAVAVSAMISGNNEVDVLL